MAELKRSSAIGHQMSTLSAQVLNSFVLKGRKEGRVVGWYFTASTTQANSHITVYGVLKKEGEWPRVPW